MKNIIVAIGVYVVLAGCNKQIDEIRPLTKIDQQGELSSVAGVQEVTAGNYLLLIGNGLGDYSSALESISESRGNNVTLRQYAPVSNMTDAFFYRNSSAEQLGYSATLYRGAYQIIVGANAALEGIERLGKNFRTLTEKEKNDLLYAKGENIFIRALTYFNLTRIYGKPFYQDAQNSLAVPLKKTSDINDNPRRATVKQIYDFLIPELQMAAQLMKVPISKTNAFANTGAAWALLSRMYLYMGGTVSSPNATYNQLSVLYADSIINSEKYSLRQGKDYLQMFGDDEDGTLKRLVFNDNREIIFALNNSIDGIKLGQFYHYDNRSGGGIFKPSSDFVLTLPSGDLRATFLKKNVNTQTLETTKWLVSNSTFVTRAPEILFRFAEVYLNRAEANAKLKNFSACKADLQLIHVRAGLPASDIENINNSDLLNAVLKERRVELAFEGQIGYDYFRNGLPMKRIAADNNGNEMVIQPDDPKVVFNIPAF
ncbi:RagB/SusD family nutrient uptake outer membrane protein [Chitinophaga sp. 22321]|uniref:RagB/SusD family nutrient uptake outer membrane protein n=1 Tax=Chitinophaga hostae TaxID=2831022 RepID=A0ABS5IXI0_9BACT|nr:RagB/SusD family nutrient uptake outer membrane protein [Chitinophaga hostae]MBS0027682.1 RagB/SusD family nutrient uptake outer membrane protein [Chitinophaga hostae]